MVYSYIKGIITDIEPSYITIENNKTNEKTNVAIDDFIKYLQIFEHSRKEKITIEEIINGEVNKINDLSNKNVKKK